MDEKAKIKLRGVFHRECFDKNGNLKWEDWASNLVTNEGLDHILDAILHASTQITTWYALMFESDSTPAAAWTYAVPIMTETTAYDEVTRPEYVEAASSGQSITNSANKAQFTINASKTMYGAALVGGGTTPTTKGDVAGGGTLLCAATFAAARAVIDDDVINLTYTISAADDGV